MRASSLPILWLNPAMSVNMMAARRRLSARCVLAVSSGMATIIKHAACSCQTGRGLVAGWLLRSDTAVNAESRAMHVGQAVARCPGCAAQAAHNAALQQEMTRLHAEVAQLRAQLQ